MPLLPQGRASLKRGNAAVSVLESLVNSEWFERAADNLTGIMAAIMHLRQSQADRIVNATVAKLGALGATAGVYGVAALVGTASTGTAIGTLSGAAATSATLAWIGGSVFTGTIVLAGIAAVGGWTAMRLWKGKPRKYDSLESKEKNIVNACANLAKAFREQAKLGTVPDAATLQIVVREGLEPLLERLEAYLASGSIKDIYWGNLSVGGRVRAHYHKKGLELRVANLNEWVQGEHDN